MLYGFSHAQNPPNDTLPGGIFLFAQHFHRKMIIENATREDWRCGESNTGLTPVIRARSPTELHLPPSEASDPLIKLEQAGLQGLPKK